MEEGKHWLLKIDFNDEKGTNPISPNLYINRGICPQCKTETLEEKGKVGYNDLLFVCSQCKKMWLLTDESRPFDELFESQKCSLCEQITPLYELTKDMKLCLDCKKLFKKKSIEGLISNLEKLKSK